MERLVVSKWNTIVQGHVCLVLYVVNFDRKIKQ